MTWRILKSLVNLLLKNSTAAAIRRFQRRVRHETSDLRLLALMAQESLEAWPLTVSVD